MTTYFTIEIGKKHCPCSGMKASITDRITMYHSLQLSQPLFQVLGRAPTMTGIIITFMYYNFSVLKKGPCICPVF